MRQSHPSLGSPKRHMRRFVRQRCFVNQGSNKIIQGLKAFGLCAAALLTTASQAANQRFCVYDMLGTGGDLYNVARDYAITMQKYGASIELKGYTDERVAAEDFRTGQCDGLIATGLRVRQFNQITGTIDALGATTIVRDGKIDIPASYEVVRRLIQTFSSPKALPLLVNDVYEIGGILPLGAAYPFLNDRRINTVEGLAGKKIAALDFDKAQAVMIQRIGAQPVAADITTFAPKFNNGMVDMVGSPAMAYKPLELYKGIGKNGGITRFPLLILTYQVVFNRTKFGPGFGDRSREYWLTHFDGALALIANAENSIPASVWNELPGDNAVKYTLMLRQARVDIAEQGLYNKRALRIIKKVRCSINPSDAECSTQAEYEWKTP